MKKCIAVIVIAFAVTLNSRQPLQGNATKLIGDCWSNPADPTSVCADPGGIAMPKAVSGGRRWVASDTPCGQVPGTVVFCGPTIADSDE